MKIKAVTWNSEAINTTAMNLTNSFDLMYLTE